MDRLNLWNLVTACSHINEKTLNSKNTKVYYEKKNQVTLTSYKWLMVF